MAKMAPDDLSTLKWYYWTTKKYWTKHYFSFIEFIIFNELERKNDFSGNLANRVSC